MARTYAYLNLGDELGTLDRLVCCRQWAGNGYQCGSPEDHEGYRHAENDDEVYAALGEGDCVRDVDGDVVIGVNYGLDRDGDDDFQAKYVVWRVESKPEREDVEKAIDAARIEGDSSSGHYGTDRPGYFLIPNEDYLAVTDEAIEAALASIREAAQQ